MLPAFPPNRGEDADDIGELPTATLVNFGAVAGGHNLIVNNEVMVPDNIIAWPKPMAEGTAMRDPDLTARWLHVFALDLAQGGDSFNAHNVTDTLLQLADAHPELGGVAFNEPRHVWEMNRVANSAFGNALTAVADSILATFNATGNGDKMMSNYNDIE